MVELLKAENISKKFKGKMIFENVSFIIEKGSSYGFVGANGCGKSVLFKILCGYSIPTTGKVIYNGVEIGKDKDFIFDAGIIIEQPEFIAGLSGLENLKILAQINNKISEKEILEILTKLNLYDDKDKKVKKYSLGMKQKLRIAQAIMENPQILILDEPMNGLDKTSIQMVTSMLNEYVLNGGTLLMTSHIEEQIKECCKKVFEFDNFHLVCDIMKAKK